MKCDDLYFDSANEIVIYDNIVKKQKALSKWKNGNISILIIYEFCHFEKI